MNNGRFATSYPTVVPSDTVAQPFTFLWVGGAGNVVVKNAAGQIGTFDAVPAGTQLNVSGQYVMAATTATNIVACN